MRNTRSHHRELRSRRLLNRRVKGEDAPPRERDTSPPPPPQKSPKKGDGDADVNADPAPKRIRGTKPPPLLARVVGRPRPLPRRYRIKRFERTEMLLRSGKKLITTCPVCLGKGTNLNMQEWCADCRKRRFRELGRRKGEDAPPRERDTSPPPPPPRKRTEKVSRSRKKYTEMDEEIQPIRKLNPNCPCCSGKGSSSNIPEWCDYCQKRMRGLVHPQSEEAPEWDTVMEEELQPRRKLNQNCPACSGKGSNLNVPKWCDCKRTEKGSSSSSRSRKKYTEMDEEILPIRKLNPNCPCCSGKGSSSNVPEWCDYCQKRKRGLVHPQIYAGGELFGVCRRMLTLPADGRAPYRQRVRESKLWINGVLVCENGFPVAPGREEAEGDQAVDSVEELQN